MTAVQALTYVDVEVPYCGLTYGQGACEAQLGPADESAVAAQFDGTTTYLRRAGGLTGAADSKLLTGSVWFRSEGTIGERFITAANTLAGAETTSRFVLSTTTNQIVVSLFNAAGTEICNIVGPVFRTDGHYHHVMFSIDLSNTSKRHMYVDGVAVTTTIAIYTNDTVDFTKADWSIGSHPSGATKAAGRMAELWFAPGVYIDLSVASNRYKFRLANGQPANLGPAGALPTGSSPLVYMRANGTSFVNVGTGGAFTVNGTLTMAVFGTAFDKCFNTPVTCQDSVHFDMEEHPTGVSGYDGYIAATPGGGTATGTALAVPIGDEAPEGSTRVVVVTGSVVHTAVGTTLVSATIGGVAATIRAQSHFNQSSSFVIEANSDPGGTTADVVTTWSAATVYGLGFVGHSLVDYVYESSMIAGDWSSVSGNVSLSRDDYVVGQGSSYSAPTTPAWTNMTQDFSGFMSSIYSVPAHFQQTDDADVVRTLSFATTLAATPTVPQTVAVTDTGSGFSVSLSSLLTSDFIFTFVETNNTDTFATPSGWNLLWGALTSTNTRLHAFWRQAGATSVSTTFPSAGTYNHVAGVSIVVRGAGGIHVGSPTTGSGTAITIPTITPPQPNSLVFDIVSRGNDLAGAGFSGWTNANLTSLTELYDDGTATGDGGGVAVNVGTKATSAATGSTTVTKAVSGDYIGVKISVEPALQGTTIATAVYAWANPLQDSDVSMRFSLASDYRPVDPSVFPLLSGQPSFTPATLNPGEDLGTRATLRVQLKDAPHSDAGPGLDKYHDERDYDPYDHGTFFGRFRNRQPYLRNRPVVWHQGFLGETEDQFYSQNFILEGIDGPNQDGVFTITAHDPLKMLDGDRSQCPLLSEGRLQSDMTNSATTFTIFPAGVGASYPASGYIAIGGTEVVSFTRSGDSFTIVRGQMNTTAVTHKGADRVQLVKIFDSMDAADIIYDLCVNFAGVPSSYIPLAEWQSETTAFLRRVYTAYIAEPTSVNLLISELMQQCGLSMWWDPLNAQLRLRVLRQIATDTGVYSESVYQRGTFTVQEQQDKRVSQVWTFYGQINPLKGIEDRDNYRSSVLTVDLEAESNYGDSQIKKIYSRWIGEGGRTSAQRVNELQISRYTVPPRLFTYSLFRGAQLSPDLGSGYMVNHRVLQDEFGNMVDVPVQIISVDPKSDSFAVRAEEFNYATLTAEDLTNRQLTIDSNTYEINARDLHDDIYPPASSGDTVRIIIESGVVVGALTTSSPAFDVGTWPTLATTGSRTNGSAVITGIPSTAGLAAGMRLYGTGIQQAAKILTVDSGTQVTMTLTANATSSAALTFGLVNVIVENRGRIAGCGGKGGQGRNNNGSSAGGPSGANGFPGGVGLYARYPFTYIEAGATTAGGGGGGAGGGCGDYDDHRGGGGGGGAGAIPGAGGVGPQSAEEGFPGTLTAGGAGGRGYTATSVFSGPKLTSSVKGGAGGAPGSNGGNYTSDPTLSGGSPGSGGKSIDGIAYVNTQGATGTRLGGTV